VNSEGRRNTTKTAVARTRAANIVNKGEALAGEALAGEALAMEALAGEALDLNWLARLTVSPSLFFLFCSSRVFWRSLS